MQHCMQVCTTTNMHHSNRHACMHSSAGRQAASLPRRQACKQGQAARQPGCQEGEEEEAMHAGRQAASQPASQPHRHACRHASNQPASQQHTGMHCTMHACIVQASTATCKPAATVKACAAIPAEQQPAGAPVQQHASCTHPPQHAGQHTSTQACIALLALRSGAAACRCCRTATCMHARTTSCRHPPQHAGQRTSTQACIAQRCLRCDQVLQLHACMHALCMHPPQHACRPAHQHASMHSVACVAIRCCRTATYMHARTTSCSARHARQTWQGQATLVTGVLAYTSLPHSPSLRGDCNLRDCVCHTVTVTL